MTDKEKVQPIALHLKMALEELRKLRNAQDNELGKRELSEAITCIETGSMFAIRSIFTKDQLDYDPMRLFND